MVQTLEPRLCLSRNMMFSAIIGTKHCVWEKQTEQGLRDQVIMANSLHFTFIKVNLY